MLLSAFKGAIAVAGEEMAPCVLAFVSRAVRLMLHPENKPMHPIVSKVRREEQVHLPTLALVGVLRLVRRSQPFTFICATQFILHRPVFDINEIPLFYALFNSGSDQYKTERAWYDWDATVYCAWSSA